MRKSVYLLGVLLLMTVYISAQAATVLTARRQGKQQQPLPKHNKTSKTSTKSKPQSEMPALDDDNEQKLRNKLEKELALIKKYYTDRNDAAGFARYRLAEQQNVGNNLSDLQRARELVLANLHIPLPN